MSRQTRLKRQLTRLYSGTAVTIGTLLVGSAIALPPGAIAQETSPKDTRIAQLFYPPAAGPQIIAVTGQGYAKVPADLAQINVVVTNQKSPEPYASPNGKRPPEPEPITAASLEGIVQALQAAGIARDKIKINVNPINPNRPYFSRSTSSVSVDLSQPTPERVGQIIRAVNTVFQKDGDKAKIYLENVYVQYIVMSCEAVENAAYASAMQDAKLRANAVAKAMGVQLSSSPSVAELPFLGRFNSPCSQERDIVGTVFRRPASAYDPSTPAIVEVYRELAVTYRQ
jgi:uncharacterized protein YggE